MHLYHLIVTCAIIEQDGKVLVAQRSESMPLPLQWEFPGGKLEPGETPEDCLIREIKEELNLDIAILSNGQSHPHLQGQRTIELIPFRCKIIGGEIRLAEHKEIRWLAPEALPSLDWAEADIPILKDYLSEMGINTD